VFVPFEDLSDPSISAMHYLLGGVSLVLTSASGENRMFSLYVHKGDASRLFGQTKTFPALPDAATFYAPSMRNKAFLIGEGAKASLRFATTEAIRWEQTLPFTISHALIGGKYNRLMFLDTANTLHAYRLIDPHPESGFKALFTKIWYEGSSEPRYVWQSTGGTDDFEPKLSLIPVVIGTLKGTVYAMLFAVPIALLAAIYTSQFLHPNLRAWVKPVMEIMASLPSVILGFLAALWLAPLLESRVPSLLLILLFVPIAALLFGHFWSSLPLQYRNHIKPGYEFVAFMPVLFIVAYLGWQLGPWLERMFFVVQNSATGEWVADFRLWWPQVTGMRFEQRNSLVVGFMMGFAVIPIIFTITEDSLSSVPPALKSGSLALGASRWQTAIRIILPTASAGLFSAVMIGLGRAVGETMIVLMATGNTPVMDFNMFSGMRTLSANIAVELPEAPQYGTLYRTLFLGAMVLFLMTFLVNTLAEIVRQRLRERFRTV
jgi:phosphate transport system permease protein